MKKLLVCALLAGSVAYGAPSAQAHCHHITPYYPWCWVHNVCSGTGQAVLSAGLSYYPTVTTNVTFTFTFNCASGGSVTGSGVLSSASCGKSSGTGTLNGNPIAVETAGSMLVVTGSATGGGNATPIPDTSTVPFSNSCSNGTAKVFTLAGGISY